MKKSLLSVISCLCALVGMGTMHADSNAGACKVHYDPVAATDIVYITWVTYDDEGLSHAMAASGPLNDSGSWIAQEISIDPAGSDEITQPILFIDPTTETVLALWEYWDSTYNTMLVGGATTVGIGGTWTSRLISDQNPTFEYSGEGDQLASIDEQGNLIVTWSAYNLETGSSIARAAVGTLIVSDDSATISWTSSFIIPGGSVASKAAITQKNKVGNTVKRRQAAFQKRQAVIAKPQSKKSVPNFVKTK